MLAALCTNWQAALPPDKSKFDCSRNDTEQGRMENDNFRTGHALAPRTARQIGI